MIMMTMTIIIPMMIMMIVENGGIVIKVHHRRVINMVVGDGIVSLGHLLLVMMQVHRHILTLTPPLRGEIRQRM